ncbi:MAG: prepilin peptidase [Phycisphaerales bacterium]|nr:MAG: prepilin peptidase [Phycisphaerales bacterium]
MIEPHLDLLLAQNQTIWALYHVPILVFLFMFGACVGSFLNVVIYRLPEGMSVISPPSRCPTCGAKLRFFRENLPILGWFMLRGRCRFCGVKISPQYMIIETLMALLMVGLYVVLIVPGNNTPWWGQIGGPWWHANGFIRAWPVFIAFAFLIASLVAMTMIDARTFTIPIQIPLFVTFTAFIAYPLQVILPHRTPTSQTWPIPGVSWQWFAVAVGGTLGVVISVLLLRLGKLRYSFADYEQYVPEGEVFGDYPHARREMGRELVFLLPCIVGLAAGGLIGSLLPATAPPQFIQALGGTFIGYLVGGAMIWVTRILGTLAVGREAMGLGDVHLLAAVGAVLGWFDVIMIFFIAPFSGLAWALLSMGLGTVFRKMKRELPYGPHLAVATVVLILCRPAVNGAWSIMLPTVPRPKAGFVTGSQAAPGPFPTPLPPPAPQP